MYKAHVNASSLLPPDVHRPLWSCLCFYLCPPAKSCRQYTYKPASLTVACRPASSTWLI